ncbi:tRNA (adenosine(37)-N6)-threonylcarbamoyltransferase complex ATPase subunit type 1 TsaE [Anaerococcus sp. AGMB00486]|uniref:tRNA threonylcarbamoyladenosine biosynthesis protein TsaE n=2 Tax=Anaerococcus TaxID=165779 RepID=A0ABX2NDE7_9FIRM|nr:MULTISPECIES: tRNA (adenosine(37)-N6)-threonylcarbamoyltransferase complex ATPase subunit type 1 TsaE [Anaerococcus]MDY3005530.1 tRNA (adenosine(37)-N6)-threonylcarbamoyltransferase complex ATPase subunit type 1 TsaE [Anaerococcus porci]MSS78624.1 tRNA (adenosine(37)-N6)-threonylcarbamoyltransferase complex ATPase subunit type 1 TsaE [Anaerococcus porci]NVF12492.1 tRNA (adenosine(37)-N6)-threonylcarbamoyltransferase complex ATPase subunit type 1 TsaE [Anaerococcus faecalis]
MRINSLNEMRDFAFDFAKKLRPGQVINLVGDMGAGKTTFVSFVGEYLEVSDTSSPTFAIVNIYNVKDFDIYHLDLYRFENEDDILDIDFETYFYPEDAITFIEWADRAKSYLPDDMIEVRIEKINENTRDISII